VLFDPKNWPKHWSNGWVFDYNEKSTTMNAPEFKVTHETDERIIKMKRNSLSIIEAEIKIQEIIKDLTASGISVNDIAFEGSEIKIYTTTS
jgi:hypothetical protein